MEVFEARAHISDINESKYTIDDGEYKRVMSPQNSIYIILAVKF